jgi:hypothetical protein
MKFCKNCENSKEEFCSIKNYKVSINANFCDDYKNPNEKRTQVLLWAYREHGVKIEIDDNGSWIIDNYVYKAKDFIDLILAWGDKCLNEIKK